MASTGTTQAIEPAPQHPASPRISSRHRWIDLGLVLLLGFAPLLVSAVYRLFFPITDSLLYVNLRFLTGLVQEIGILILCITLLRRQGRSLRDIGFGFRWNDLLKAVGLFALSNVMMIIFATTIQYAHFVRAGTYLQFRNPK